jgi:hypothetical protein
MKNKLVKLATQIARQGHLSPGQAARVIRLCKSRRVFQLAQAGDGELFWAAALGSSGLQRPLYEYLSWYSVRLD